MRMEIAHNRRILRLDPTSHPAATRAATFALFALLAVVHTWPLASAPGRLSRDDNADTLLNQWIISWVAHQASHDPLHLINANIFYPERGTLAYSEYLIVPAAIGAPVRWAGGSPLVEYNVLVLAGLTLTGWAGCLLVSRWTGDPVAGIIGGVIIAFNAHTLTRLPQLQALHIEFLPLSLLAFESLLAGQGSVVLLALCVILQGLTSYYSLVLTVTALGAGWAVRLEDRRHALVRPPRTLLRVAAAAALALIVLVPALVPYVRLGRVRSLEEAALYSAAARDYLATPARLHYGTWSARFFGGTTALFPGLTAIVLSGFAIFSGVAFRNPRARMALAIGLAGIALSFGPSLPGGALLYRLFLPLQGIRNMARFGYLATVAAGILAGFGVARLREQCSRRRSSHEQYSFARWVPVGIVAVFISTNLDAFSAPIEYVDGERVSPIHARLRETSAIVAEFPFYPADRLFRHAPYLLHSTAHWRPMANGYSGLTPDSFIEHARDLARFPDRRAIETLGAIGVTHVFVHDRAMREWTDNETANAVRTAPGLKLLETDGDVTLYEVVKTADGSS